jgi:hypothetical protein
LEDGHAFPPIRGLGSSHLGEPGQRAGQIADEDVKVIALHSQLLSTAPAPGARKGKRLTAFSREIADQPRNPFSWSK